jgi:multicomponent Na+:H+ antiporter subunit E
MKRLATTFVLVFITWLVLTYSLHPEEVLIGIAISLVITLISRHLLAPDTPRIILHPVRWFWFLVYIGHLLVLEIRAHIDVGSRVFSGRIRPAIVEVPVEFNTLLGKTLLGNSITMTPGTLTVNSENEEKFYIHTIGYRKELAIEKPFRKFGRRVIE